VARLVRRGLAARGIRFAGRSRLGRGGRNAAAIARRVRRSRADGMIFGGITANGAPRLFNAVHRGDRRVRLVGSDGVAESGFTTRLSRGTRARTRVTVATLAPDALPPAAQPVVQALRDRSGGREPDPYALFGYEAMSLALDAIGRARDHGGERGAVRQQLFATRDRDSVLGRYSIDANGDTTLSTYGAYRVAHAGELVFDRVIDSSAP
jgi:branched-chain amino acid transport system substrate-binding protein